MAKYKIEMMTFDELSKKKSIPRYQRPLVWTKPKKQTSSTISAEASPLALYSSIDSMTTTSTP